ncbi:MAG: hypothetical protein RTU92_03890 [Candidatus Thorarchaeota archaeon]
MSELSDWFHVTINDEHIQLRVEPPGGKGYKASIAWKSIIRVCFIPGDFMTTDEIYIFVQERPESYVIPTEADGGLDVWNAIIEKGLFDAELAIKVASEIDGKLHCWPQDE